jgi:hypothetical protein
MNKVLYLMFCVLCILAGLAGYAADTYLNVEYVGFDNTGPVITIIVLAVCSAISLTAASMAIKTGKYFVSVLCSVGFVAAVCWSAPVSLSRISSSIDDKVTKVQSHVEKKSMLEKAYSEVTQLRQQESKKGGCGKNCRALFKREVDLLKEITSLGVPQETNGAGKRLAYAIPFLDAKTVEMVVPISAVVALTCLMNGLLVFGISSILTMFNQKSVMNDIIRKTEEILKQDNVLDGNKIIPIEKKRQANNDPVVNLVEKEGEVSLSDVQKFMDRSAPFVSMYVSDLERRGLVKKSRNGRKVLLTLPSPI